MHTTPPFFAIALMTSSGMLRTMRRNRLCRGMRCQHRRLALFHCIQHGFIGDVRNIHHHAHPIHLAHQFAARLRQPVVASASPVIESAKAIRLRSAPASCSGCPACESAQHAEAVGDQVAALQARQGGQLCPICGSARHQPRNRRTPCPCDWRRPRDAVLPDIRGQRGSHALRWIILRLRVDAKQHGAQLAFLHARDIQFVIAVLVLQPIAFVQRSNGAYRCARRR